jgi:uncharacterized protein YjiS (DUF1127 family)
MYTSSEAHHVPSLPADGRIGSVILHRLLLCIDSAITRMTDGLGAALRRISAGREERRMIRLMHMLDDRMLADIGLVRGEIRCFVRRSIAVAGNGEI